MRRIVMLGASLLVLTAVPSAVQAKAVEYMSQHPLPRKMGHGFCYIDVPHVHDFGPSDPRLYRQVGGQYYFVGDPAPFDYEGPRYSYYGAHPVVEVQVQVGAPVYCYLQGPHYHWYQPPPQASFELKGGAYWYIGTYDPVFYQDRPRYVAVNEAYAPIVYSRPVVDVTVAPPGFHGEIVAAGPGWRGHAVVGAPAVSAGVYVAAPPPPTVQIGVGIGLGVGGPPAVIERREIYQERHRHDNGRHNGWYKNGDWRRGGAHDRGWRGGGALPPPPPAGSGWRGNPPPAPPAAHGPKHGGGWKR